MKPPRIDRDINKEVFEFMDIIKRNPMTIKEIEKQMNKKSALWYRADKGLFRKIMAEKLHTYFITNNNT
jgi:hypothetical protein